MITVYSGTNSTYKAMDNDTKPTNCRNGDRLLAIDTGTLLLYDEENTQWRVFRSNIGSTLNLVSLDI